MRLFAEWKHGISNEVKWKMKSKNCRTDNLIWRNNWIVIVRVSHECSSLAMQEYFTLVIRKKEDRIGTHDIKLHRLQQRILHVEKRKYVLDYKTKSLMERIEPLDQEILQLKTNNQSLEQQLTNLKRQQNDLIQREKDYRGKLDQSSQQLTLARRDHQHLSKIIKRDKGSTVSNIAHRRRILLDIIKRAFDLVEISCTSTSIRSIETPREQLRKFMESVCHTIQNEQQTENQLEIEGFMKEWSDQRHWLLNHVRGGLRSQLLIFSLLVTNSGQTYWGEKAVARSCSAWTPQK